MNRRDFSSRLAGLGLCSTALATPLLAQAQAGVQLKDSDYVRLATPVAVEKGKVEVLEFFWYGCPHCFSFEPALDAWQKKLPADVAFRRVPVAFRESFAVHQRIFYALDAMGQVDTLHRKVFQAIHGEKQRLEKEEDILAFVKKNGVDPVKFKEVFTSFTVSTKAKQASRLVDAYKIDGVPALGIGGKYFTSGQIAGSPERALLVADALIARVRQGG